MNWEQAMEDAEFFPQHELVNALQQSQQEFQDDLPKVCELQHLGRWVVVSETTAYCPRTDAVMCQRTTLLGDYENQEQAEQAAQQESKDPEEYVRVLPPIKPEQDYHAPTNEEIPF